MSAALSFTLAEARAANACKRGYRKFRAALVAAHPGVDPDTVRWSIGDIAVTNGPEDAVWCLRLLRKHMPDPDYRRAVVRAIMPAVKRASVHTDDERVHWTIAEIERWLAGDDSVDLRAAAYAVAYAAAYAAADAAKAAYAAARAEADAAKAAYAAGYAGYAAERAQQARDLIALFPALWAGGAA